MKPNQEVIVFSPEDFEQLLELQQELESLDNMEEENQTNGECKISLMID